MRVYPSTTMPPPTTNSTASQSNPEDSFPSSSYPAEGCPQCQKTPLGSTSVVGRVAFQFNRNAMLCFSGYSLEDSAHSRSGASS